MEKQQKHQKSGHHHEHDHHAMMIRDFRLRFWVSLIITVPILVLSPMIQELAGLRIYLWFFQLCSFRFVIVCLFLRRMAFFKGSGG